MVVQAQLDRTGAWKRTSDSPVRVFGCCEKGSQRLLPQKSRCQGHFPWPLRVPVCQGRQSWESWVNRILPTSPRACAATCQISPKNPQGSSPEQERRKGKQDWQKIGLYCSPSVKSLGISHLTYRPHQFSLWVYFRLQEAAGSRNPACSYSEGYGGLCHIIIFINPSSFILKLARAQFLLFL